MSECSICGQELPNSPLAGPAHARNARTPTSTKSANAHQTTTTCGNGLPRTRTCRQHYSTTDAIPNSATPHDSLLGECISGCSQNIPRFSMNSDHPDYSEQHDVSYVGCGDPSQERHDTFREAESAAYARLRSENPNADIQISHSAQAAAEIWVDDARKAIVRRSQFRVHREK